MHLSLLLLLLHHIFVLPCCSCHCCYVALAVSAFCLFLFSICWGLLLFWRNLLIYVVILIVVRSAMWKVHLCEKSLIKKEEEEASCIASEVGILLALRESPKKRRHLIRLERLYGTGIKSVWFLPALQSSRLALGCRPSFTTTCGRQRHQLLEEKHIWSDPARAGKVLHQLIKVLVLHVLSELRSLSLWPHLSAVGFLTVCQLAAL